MGSFGSKSRTPEETAALVSATAITRGLDVAKTRIVSILGRKPPFQKVHIGLTDVDLGKTSVVRGGYTITGVFTAATPQVAASVLKSVGDWLVACHGPRCEAVPAKPVVKPGSKTVYVAVSY
jgi:hypothetical protein